MPDGESGQSCEVLELEGRQYGAWSDFCAQLPVGRKAGGAQRMDPAQTFGSVLERFGIMAHTKRYSPETRDRAARMVLGPYTKRR